MQTFSALQSLDIIIRMETALAGEGNMVVYCLKKAIRDKQPANLIITTVKDMIRDNETAVQHILGAGLTEKIKNFVI